jgi:hypothetical protein
MLCAHITELLNTATNVVLIIERVQISDNNHGRILECHLCTVDGVGCVWRPIGRGAGATRTRRRIRATTARC